MAAKKRAKGDKGKAGAEFRFRIDAYTPKTLPMARLAEYMAELATLLGQPDNVHFLRVAEGSAALVSWVEHEAIPKVRERTTGVRRDDAPSEAMRSYKRLNTFLREDNTKAVLHEKGSRTAVLKFPGKDQPVEQFGAVRQQGSIDGLVRGVKGTDDTIHITLVSEDHPISRIHTNPETAKRLAKHWDEMVRLFGLGKWRRNSEGVWALEEFRVREFVALDNTPLSEALEKIRAVKSDWNDDSYIELGEIRHGPNGGDNGGI